MATTSDKYWAKRKARETYEMTKDVDKVGDELASAYAQASAEIEKEARRLVRRFQLKHHLTEREAERLIASVKSPEDIKALIAELAKNPQNADIVQQLESQAFGARLNRLTTIQQSIDGLTLGLLGQNQIKFAEVLTDVARGAYYREVFAMQKRANAVYGFNPLDADRIMDIMGRRWSGRNYSDRLWDNTEALAADVKKELVVGLLTGKSTFKMSKDIERKFHSGASATRRLLRTESNYVANQMAAEAYKDAGIDKYIYVAILDMRTSLICQDMDGKTYNVADAQAGYNYPPMHPWCRSTTIAWMPEQILKKLQRSAINPRTGERIKVPANMTYKEWYNKYVVGLGDIEVGEILPRDMLVNEAGRLEEWDAEFFATIKHDASAQEKLDRTIYATLMYDGKRRANPVKIEVAELQDKIDKINETFKDIPDASAFVHYHGEKKGDVYRRACEFVDAKLGANALPADYNADDALAVKTFKTDTYGDVLYRGVGDNITRQDLKTAGLSPSEMVDQYKNGAFFAGTGIYGDGTYCCALQSEAEKYGNPVDGIFEISLKKDARIIQFEDAYQIWVKTKDKIKEGLLQDPYCLVYSPRAETKGQSKYGAIGRLMNMLGYDAIKKFNGDWSGENYWVILNRGASMVKRSKKK